MIPSHYISFFAFKNKKKRKRRENCVQIIYTNSGQFTKKGEKKKTYFPIYIQEKTFSIYPKNF
jgi:hypothetical protein